MKKNIVLFIALLPLLLFSYEKIDYDWHTPTKHISATALALGGLNHFYSADYGIAYDNPALLAANTRAYAAITLRNRRIKDNINLSSAMNPAYLLKDKQITYAAFSGKKFAFSYQPVINITKRTKSDTLITHNDVIMNQYTISLAATDTKFKNLMMGFNIKLIDGKQVYNSKYINGPVQVQREFINHNATGYSTDIAIAYKRETMFFGLSAYDVLSKIYWEGRKNATLKQRWSFGTGYYNRQNCFSIGTQGRFDDSSLQTYHIGYGYNYRSFNWKLGMFSHKFDSRKEVYVTSGISYALNIFKIDLTAVTRGLTLNDTDWVISISLGETK